MGETIVGSDGKSRCSWCGAAPEFQAYHDTEWGFPVSGVTRVRSQYLLIYSLYHIEEFEGIGDVTLLSYL